MIKRNVNIGKYHSKDIVKGERTVKRNAYIGDKVLIFKKKLGNKLGSSWNSGYTVKDLVGSDAYIVTNGWSELRLNKKHVKVLKGERGVS